MGRRSSRKLDVVLKPAAIRNLRKLERQDRRRIGDRIDALAAEPRPSGMERLRGKEGLVRIRVGDFRIIYLVDDEAREVLVVKIKHRHNAYRKLP